MTTPTPAAAAAEEFPPRQCPHCRHALQSAFGDDLCTHCRRPDVYVVLAQDRKTGSVIKCDLFRRREDALERHAQLIAHCIQNCLNLGHAPAEPAHFTFTAADARWHVRAHHVRARLIGALLQAAGLQTAQLSHHISVRAETIDCKLV